MNLVVVSSRVLHVLHVRTIPVDSPGSNNTLKHEQYSVILPILFYRVNSVVTEMSSQQPGNSPTPLANVLRLRDVSARSSLKKVGKLLSYLY